MKGGGRQRASLLIGHNFLKNYMELREIEPGEGDARPWRSPCTLQEQHSLLSDP